MRSFVHRIITHAAAFAAVLMLCTAPIAAQYYQQRIFYPAGADDRLRVAVEDLKEYLGKATGKTFSATPGTHVNQQPGIHLVIGSHPQLQDKGIEVCMLEGDDQSLTITSTHTKGLCHGIYTYLHKLGLRWYFPGDDWEYVPALKSIVIHVAAFDKPSMRVRTFAGTGGLPEVKSVDPGSTVQKSWGDWMRRNRMGGAILPGGHYWESFNTEHKAILERHPEYLAMIKGKREPWSVITKFCISNKELVKLFVDDRIGYLKTSMRSGNHAPEELTLIPVDPSDGGGHCTCGPCLKMGTPSDRVFYLANEVAKAAAAVNRNAFVNLYAYNQHAEPPRQPLEKNVIVQVIPYAFQSIGTPEEMIRRWKSRHGNLIIYDYYGIPDWHKDMPLSDRWSPASFAARMKYWMTNGIDGVTLESSNSIGCTGEGLYYMARLGWNINESPEQIADDFYTQMFGSAKPAMKQFFTKLHKDYNVNTDIPVLLQSLEQADKAAGTDLIRRRIGYYKAYLQYIVLAQEFVNAPAGQDEDRWTALMSYTWQVYTTCLLHSSRIAFLYGQPSKYISKYPEYSYYTQVRNEKPLRLPAFGYAVAERNFQNDRKAYEKLSGVLPSISSPGYGVDYDNTANPAGAAPHDIMLRNPDVFVIRGNSKGIFSCFVKSNVASGGNDRQDVVVSVIGKDGKKVFTETIVADKDWRQITIRNLTSGKDYSLQVTNKSWFWIRVEPAYYFGITSIPTYSVMGNLRMYVPSTTGTVLFSAKNGLLPVFTAPDGSVVAPEQIKDNTYRLNVAATYRGKWWTISQSQYKELEFYIKPSLFFTHTNYSISPR